MVLIKYHYVFFVANGIKNKTFTAKTQRALRRNGFPAFTEMMDEFWHG